MFIIQLGSRFAFCHRPTKTNGSFMHFPMEAFVTPYGFFMPCGVDSFGVLDFLDGVPPVSDHTRVVSAGYFVDQMGTLRDILVNGFQHYVRRLVTVDKTFTVRAEDGDVETAIQVAYLMFPDSLEDIVAATLKTYPMPADCVTYINIEQIRKLLKGKRLKPLVQAVPVSPKQRKEMD